MAVKKRGATFRSLGNHDVPKDVLSSCKVYHWAETYKHDSWAATARYRAEDNSQIVCKFNRLAPFGFIPMSWLGYWLAEREMWFYRALEGVENVTSAVVVTMPDGKPFRNVSAHPYIKGKPFLKETEVSDEFFDQLLALVEAMHARGIAYMDTNKRENIIIDLKGRPNLTDFQISFASERFLFGFRSLAKRILEPLAFKSDIYHVNKHYVRTKPDLLSTEQIDEMLAVPKFIEIHRKFAVPLRSFRRKILVIAGIRSKSGMATSEAEPEAAFRKNINEDH